MFKKTTLPNGLRVITAPMKNTKTVTLLTIFGVGSKYENAGNAGLSHFLEHMFFKGTKKRPNSRLISEYLDEVGGEYNAFTSKEYTGFYAKVASEHTERAFDMIADILLNSKFAAADIDKERGVILEEMHMYQDTPMSYVGDLFEQLVYGSQPAGRLIIGNKKSISEVKRSDFIDYYNKFYTATNMVICVAGDITEHSGLELIDKYFSGVTKNKAGSKKAVTEKQNKPALLLHHKDTDQTHISLGFRAFDIFDDRKYALNLLSVILGGGMSSRLFMSVREKFGLAYYISCDNQTYTDSGYLNVHAGLDKNKVNKAVTVILKELSNIKDQEVSEKELTKVKEYIKGRTIMGLETSDSYASWLSSQEVLTKEIKTIKEKFRRLDMVTTADIKRVAQEVIVNKGLNLAMIGPYKDEQRFKKLLKI